MAEYTFEDWTLSSPRTEDLPDNIPEPDGVVLKGWVIHGELLLNPLEVVVLPGVRVAVDGKCDHLN